MYGGQVNLKNPKYEQMPTAAALVGDHLMGVGPKIDNGFKDNLTRIADAHPDSALAERYGTKDHKRIKTKQVLKKTWVNVGDIMRDKIIQAKKDHATGHIKKHKMNVYRINKIEKG